MAGTRSKLPELGEAGRFADRHIGPSPADVGHMLKTLGLGSLDELIAKIVPAVIRSEPTIPIEPLSEVEALARLRSFASRNQVLTSMLGMGYADCVTPPVILRNVLENPGWYTAYTPYQAEISQGRLEVLVAFQQMIIDLTGMEIANASLLDEATAAAEAMTLMKRMSKSKSDAFFVAADCHPQTIAVIQTRAEPLGFTVEIGDPTAERDWSQFFGVLLQYPATTGDVRDDAALVKRAHDAGALVTVAADLLSLVLLHAPGAWGADVVVGTAQRFGVPLGFGGPHAAFMATRDSFKRTMPGRLVGVSIDSRGRAAYRLALQTREQHIRREKATSNICTAQVLLAVMAAFYAIYHGPDGLKRIASRIHRLTTILAAGLARLGRTVETRAFFDTITVAAGADATTIVDRARALGINLRRVGATRIGIAVNETTRADEIESVWQAFAGKATGFTVAELDAAIDDALPASARRNDPILSHAVFNRYHSETEMLRYMRRLEDRDIALNRAMIPLGSCTMKLNATTEMIPITWPEFARIHPFAPLDQAKGYLAMIRDLEAKLAILTGFAGVSLQPNSGAQGEYAGLLIIRAYHARRLEAHRNLVLIPASAHGTNPASAALANFEVGVVACDDHGNVDIADLKARAEQHRDRLAALMVTYPSTHGVFEEGIREVCRIVHDNGGQVYMDGANLNALVGLCRPGEFGPDVLHMNLHKTFCIPHGGGGPGVGPIAVGPHLKDLLPTHTVVGEAGPAGGIGPVSAAPWGSAGILAISWAYIAMMGTAGLKRATQVSILSANYIAKRLDTHFPVLYTGPGGFVAHECIVDPRPLKDHTGIGVEDIAKRLMDYGFHAPTMSFPVPGTLMIEPTESESLYELDRFCEAMIAIRREIATIEAGTWDQTDNPLKNAPHTADVLMSADWPHRYSRDQAAFPSTAAREAKYWPPVGRIDNVHGDRNLVCTCPPIETYRTAAE
ncbi:MAG: glycine dehydrogenase (aminomethyl-transferring) [Rhodospirillales bacterium]|nr:glycine dehydrogenase (aminomethyl-transferring) [Rhodospirillales bacterium]